ncbi:Retrovirus-related Pol polyprotein from transposon RE1 [Vitis vinifera]|uniref:Retrovirus-related Pol polyprotein from transposon RE1 n=1 Tax=Vitis vinifera TaxID=29760 RepID=A0A438HXF0_VITVI|nr:Retrovirus-related Pol polyprotein from transposon RE1 [Vitis vinifera]
MGVGVSLHVSSPKSKTLGPSKAIIHSGQISLAISQSDHLSFHHQSLLRAKGENAFRSVESSSENIHRGNFSANFRRRFFLHRKERLEEISNFPKAPDQKTIHAPPRAFFPGDCISRPAREPLSGDALPPPGSPDADQPPFLPVLPSEPCTCLFWGSFAPRALDQFFRRPPAIFSQLQSLHVPWEVFFYLSGHKLNGHNYLQWSQSVLLFICGKGKDEYLTGEAVMPETTEPGFRKWKIENSMIMSWLINSMNNDIGENFLLFGTAKDIWDAAKETYSSSENTSELFRLNHLHDFRQGEQSVTQYYNTLTSNIQENCGTKETVQVFLGLNRELDDVRGRIMGIKPLPSLREAFSEVRREESRKKVMMGSKSNLPQHWMPLPLLLGHLIVVVEIVRNGIGLATVDRDGRAHVAANSESTSVPEPSPFNKEQMEMLQKLLSQVGSGSTTGVAFTANRGGMKPWIVDTGASDHMTGDAAILQNYKPSNGHSSVHIADGSKSKIAGTGSIKLTKDLYLDSVLHVPNLDCNLLSISKLAVISNVLLNSIQTCVFQDLKSGKMIGSAELCSGLYLLSCGQFSNQVSQASCVQSQSMLESFNSVSNSKPAQHTNVPSPVTIQSPMPIQPIAPQLANENLQVYIRRRKRQELEHGSQSTCGQYIDSNSSLPEENIGEDRAGEVLIPSIDDSTLPIALRKGVRRCTDHPIGNYVTYEGLSPSYRAFATSLDDTQVPNTIQEALKISEWKKAVQDEIDALEKNGTWTITDLPDSSLIGCQSRLVLATTGQKNVFLNGDLKEEVYMEIPPGFEESMAKNQVCKLQKSLYGLKQSPRAWFDRFTKAVLKLGYKQGQANHTLFVKKSHAEKMAILIVYVDDIILSGNDMEELQKLKKYLSEEFEVKDLGNLKYFLGMEVARSRKGIVVSQKNTYSIFLRRPGNLVTWRSKKQSVIAKSSAEAEYRALAQEICSYKHSKNPVHHDRTKHVEIDRHFITEKVTSETVKLNYVPTKHQTADILTKALPRPNFEDLTCKLGLYDIYSPA